jgi:hypothetical protein
MTSIILKAIIGLFIWMVLPSLIFQKKTKKKAPYKRFTTVVCTIVGILILVYAGIDLIKLLLNFK